MSFKSGWPRFMDLRCVGSWKPMVVRSIFIHQSCFCHFEKYFSRGYDVSNLLGELSHLESTQYSCCVACVQVLPEPLLQRSEPDNPSSLDAISPVPAWEKAALSFRTPCALWSIDHFAHMVLCMGRLDLKDWSLQLYRVETRNALDLA